MSDNRKELLAWAYTVLKENVESFTFGTISINMANGIISGVKCDKHYKPPEK